MKKMLIVVVCLVLLVGCGKKSEEKSTEKNSNNTTAKVVVELENKEVEINEEIKNTSGVIKVENGELLTEEENVDTSKLGEQTIKITVKDLNGEEKEYSYNINVIDTTSPVITYKESLSTTVGTKIDLLKNVSAKDNSKENIKVTVSGDYSFEKVGTYKLKYVAKDSSGNEIKNSFTLVVKEKVVPTNPEPKNDPEPVKPTNTTSTAKAGKGTDPKLNGTKTSKGYTITVKNGVAYVDGVLIANKTYALPSTYVPSNTHTPLSSSTEISKGGIINNAYSAYLKMQTAASKAGYTINIASGYRSYAYQKKLYNSYVNRNGKADADRGSARPGHSEHQTGLGFDLNTISDSSANTNKSKWVLSNCYKYGFILRYPSGKEGKTGYKYEWWHLRYVGVDLATKLYNNGNWITLEEHFGITSKYDY